MGLLNASPDVEMAGLVPIEPALLEGLLADITPEVDMHRTVTV